MGWAGRNVRSALVAKCCDLCYNERVGFIKINRDSIVDNSYGKETQEEEISRSG